MDSKELQKVADDVKNGKSDSTYTPRELLAWYGAQRRGASYHGSSGGL